MATGNTLQTLHALHAVPTDWMYAAFTSGGTAEPAVGEAIHDTVTAAQAIIEYISPITGSWAGGDAAGYFFLSNWNGTAWDATPIYEFVTDTATDDATGTAVPVFCNAGLQWVNGIPTLTFDDDTPEVARFIGVLSQNYGGSGLDIILKQANTTATLDVSFFAMMRSFTDDVDNLLSTSFNAWGTAGSNTAIDVPSVIGEMTYDIIALTDGALMDSLAVGEAFELMIFRDAVDSTNDDNAGDAQLVHVEIQET